MTTTPPKVPRFTYTDPVELEGTIEIAINEDGATFTLAGNDITPLVTTATWYWTRGRQPRLSLDISGLTSLELTGETQHARFRRET